MHVEGELALWAHYAGMPLDTVVQRKRALAVMRLQQRAARSSWDEWPDTRPFEALSHFDVLAAHHSEVASMTLPDRAELLEAALRKVAALRVASETRAVLIGSASAGRVASVPTAAAPFLTSGRAVRGPSLLGTS